MAGLLARLFLLAGEDLVLTAKERGRGHLGGLEVRRESGAEHPGASMRELRPLVGQFHSVGDGPGLFQVVVVEVNVEERAVVDVTARSLSETRL